MIWPLIAAIVLCVAVVAGLWERAPIPEYDPPTAKMLITPAMRKWIENAEKF
jgi:hypothetical protein